MNLRDDLQLIYDWIPAGSRVLDLGCGDGELLHALVQHKNCKGYGVEIDTNSVIAAIARGVNVIQADLEQGLQAFGDGSFDVIVLRLVRYAEYSLVYPQRFRPSVREKPHPRTGTCGDGRRPACILPAEPDGQPGVLSCGLNDRFVLIVQSVVFIVGEIVYNIPNSPFI